MEYLPIRIMKMVKELHWRGYTTLYLYSGMSTTGLCWRYCIGLIKNKKWPVKPCIVLGTLGPEGEIEWVSDNSSVESLANGFEMFYADKLAGNKSSPTEYSTWYDHLIDHLGPNELLAFYADYEAPHEHLLKEAPGYNKT